MKKTPSYLTGLAETRARLAGDIERYERPLSEIPGKVAQARRELEACDLLIRRFDGRLDPQKIAPIRHWRYSKKRGVLRDTIIAIVKDGAPNEVTTLEVGWELQIRLGLTFETSTEYSRWLHGSVGCQLQLLVAERLIERLHDPLTPTSGGRPLALEIEGCPSARPFDGAACVAGRTRPAIRRIS